MQLAIVYILFSVLAGGSAQVALKYGMTRMGAVTLSAAQLPVTVWRFVRNPYVLGGLALYGIGTLFWLAALSRVDLSFAYPFASLSYIVMLAASWVLFRERITPVRLIGTMTIAVGILVISQS